MSERPVTVDEARAIGARLGINWNEVDVDEFRRGLEVEQEHGSLWGDATNVTHDDQLMTGQIAWAHLKEVPDYYTRLDKMEAEAGADYDEE